MPHQLDGVRIGPTWSPPRAIGTSPAATNAALPPEEPPALWATLCGLRITPLADVWLAPEKQRSSQAALPAMVPPASRIRVTTVASISGTYRSSNADPFIMGTPATQMLSLIAIFLPVSRPLRPALIFVFQYQAPYGFSDAEGRYPGERGAIGAKAGGTNSSSRPYEAKGPLKAC